MQAYQTEAARKSDLERTELAKKKTGVFTGAYAINPVNQERIPIWIADYVLASYGTGAIMAVPAHDLRDFEFAAHFGLPIRPVVQPPEGYQPSKEESALAYEEGEQDTLPLHRRRHRDQLRLVQRPADGRVQAADHRLAGGARPGLSPRSTTSCATGCSAGSATGASRSRSCTRSTPQGKPTGVIEPLSPEELPLRLPDLEDYKPSGKAEPPLSKATDWLYVTRHGKRYRRETNTMPQWAGSCWYYLRYIDPHNDKAFCDPQKERYWMPVDLYVGGAEHAVLHLLYSRFWHKVLFDRGHVHTPEPFQRLVNQGMILGEMEFTGYKENGVWCNPPPGFLKPGESPKKLEDGQAHRGCRLRRKERFFVLKEQP